MIQRKYRKVRVLFFDILKYIFFNQVKNSLFNFNFIEDIMDRSLRNENCMIGYQR